MVWPGVGNSVGETRSLSLRFVNCCVRESSLYVVEVALSLYAGGALLVAGVGDIAVGAIL